MLSFFPTAYPDELFYSIITRYHIRSGNRNFKQTLIEVLEYSSQQSCNLDLPNNLARLVSCLPLGSTYSVAEFMEEHTLYPFYRLFLTPPEIWLLKDRMHKKLNDSISNLAKIPSSKNSAQQFLKFCPVCLEQDTEEYGEAYWHRMHQVPGIFICLKHNTMLCHSSVSTAIATSYDYPASLETCAHQGSPPTADPHTLQNLRQLAQNIEFLMSRSFDFKGLQWLRKQYQGYLSESKLVEVRAGGNIKFNQQKFLETILDAYKQSFWEMLKPEAAQKLDRYLQYCLFGCDVNPTIDRVTHIVLIHFLSSSLEEFFADR